MRFYVLFLFMIASTVGSGQTVLVIDFVKIKNGKFDETMYYYANNWKVYREIALEKGFIQSYRLEKTTVDSAAAFDLILITEYADTVMYKRSEENFRTIINNTRPGGPALLNDLKPTDFRQNVFVKTTTGIYKNTRSIKYKKDRGLK